MTRNVTERTRKQNYKRTSARQIISICLAFVMFLGSAFAFEPAVGFSDRQSLGGQQSLELARENDWAADWDITAFAANYTELVDLSHWQVADNELTEVSPEILEAFLREQEAYFDQGYRTSERLASIDEREFHFDEYVDIFDYDFEEFGYDAYQGIAPMSSVDHENIVNNPFALRFDANNSVSLNTGASNYRINVLSLPGRNGLDLNLDLIYSSSRAYSLGAKGFFGNLSGLYHPNFGEGWMFDLPYIQNSVLYFPGKGSYAIRNGRIERPISDMQLSYNITFTSGEHRSHRRLVFYHGTSYFFCSRGNIIGIVDRFGNTIRFEYEAIPWLFFQHIQLARIIDSNGKVITFTYDTFPAFGLEATSGTITITDPNENQFFMNLTRAAHGGVRATFLLSSVKNQAGALTAFTYSANDINIHWENKEPTERGARWDISWSLSSVNYPSGAQLRFEYDRHIINFARHGSRHTWKVSSRTLYYNGQEYLRTIFGYAGCHTAFPQAVNMPPANYTYSTTVIQNNGLRTVYTFNRWHMNISQRTYNYQGVLLSEQTRDFHPIWQSILPSAIKLTENRNNFSRSVSQQFTYNSTGQVTEVVSALAQGSALVQYRTEYTYGGFGILLEKTTRPDAQTTVVQRNILNTSWRDRVIRSYVYENNVRKSRTDFTYDAFGNVTQIREFYGNNNTEYVLTQITYNSGTRPSMIRRTGVRDANGNLVENIDRHFTYDPMWRVVSETDPNGYVTRFGYDRIGRITRIDFPNGGFVTYAYDDTRNTLTHRTALGATYIYRYDGLGSLLSVAANGVEILRNIYDNRKRVIETRNAQGIGSSQRTVFDYDIFDRVIERRSLSPTGAILQRETIEFEDVFDAEGNRRITSTVVGTGVNAGAAPNIQTFVQYDKFGRRTQEGTIGGRIVTYTHDLAGRVITEQSLGVNNTFTYNVYGVATIRNILGHTAQNTYDMLGRVVTSTDFMDNVQQFTYDALGRLLTHSVPFERSGTTVHYAETRYFYDNNGNVVRQENLVNVPGQAQVWAATENTFRYNRLISSETGGANGIKTTYTYNLAGNVLTKTVGGATTTFAYDNRGRLTRTTDALGQAETFTYDANGHLISHDDRNGTALIMAYDNLGRMTFILTWHNGMFGDIKMYAFYPTGLRQQASSGSHTITYYYDAQGRIRRQTEDGGIDKTFAYNTADNLTQSRVYVSGTLQSNSTYTFDAAQRVQTVAANGELLSTYIYNANNQRISTVSPNGLRTDYTHNLAGLVTNLTNRHGNTVLSSFDYLYYLDGNTRQVTENLEGVSRTITYTYDLARRLIREQTTGYEARDESFAFDNRGNRISRAVTGSENYTVVYSYDLNNRLLTSTRTPVGGSAEVTTFSYDRNGNQLTKTVDGITETKEYNAFNQLVRAYVPVRGVANFEADNLVPPISNNTANWDIGERAEISGKTPDDMPSDTLEFEFTMLEFEDDLYMYYLPQYEYRYEDDYISDIHEFEREPVWVEEYEPETIMTQMNYHVFEPLTSILATDIIVTYTYRADGLRHSKIVDGVRLTHVWDRGNIVLEIGSGAAIINRFDRGIFGELIRSEQHGHYLFNKRGDVVQRINAHGGVIRSYRYTAFGVELSLDEANCNPFRFASMYWDAETGTYYTPNRHFSPRFGRWTSPDPYWNIHNFQGGIGAILQASNLYIYVTNNPVMWIDLTGLYRDVMIRYAVERQGGVVIFHSDTRDVTVVMPMFTTYGIVVDRRVTYSGLDNVNGRLIINSDRLAADFYRTAESFWHQTGDIFHSAEDAALAFGLSYISRSNHAEPRRIEYGAAIYRNQDGTYTFGQVWRGVFGFTENSILVIPNPFRTHVTNVHTHWSEGFSPADISNNYHFVFTERGTFKRYIPGETGSMGRTLGVITIHPRP